MDVRMAVIRYFKTVTQSHSLIITTCWLESLYSTEHMPLPTRKGTSVIWLVGAGRVKGSAYQKTVDMLSGPLEIRYSEGWPRRGEVDYTAGHAQSFAVKLVLWQTCCTTSFTNAGPIHMEQLAQLLLRTCIRDYVGTPEIFPPCTSTVSSVKHRFCVLGAMVGCALVTISVILFEALSCACVLLLLCWFVCLLVCLSLIVRFSSNGFGR